MRLRVLAIASLITLAGCHLQTDPPGDAPSNVQVTPGDGQVTVTFNQEPGLTYWIFFQPGGSVAPAATGATVIRGATSPRVVDRLINGALVNGTQYAFIMNATKDDSAAGPSSPIVVATPRLAGDTWIAGTPPLGGATPRNLNGIAFNGSRFVVVGDAGTIFAGDYSYTSTSTSTSTPGVTAWTPPTSVPVGFAANLSAVTYSGQFVALGADGSILTSTDGLTWAPPANATNPVLAAGMNGIAFGFVSGVGTYVVVGSGGNIFTSTNLAAWTPIISGTGSDLFSISLLNGNFMVTGDGGTLLTSTDGSNWTVPTSLTPNTTNALRSAAFRSTPSALYVAVGDLGTIVTSTDGTIWTATTLPAAPNLRGVTNGGAPGGQLGPRFLAVGLGGTGVFSDDGSVWSSSSTPPSSADLARVIFTPGMYMAVGAVGANAVAK